MEKRLLLALVLTTVVLLVFGWLQPAVPPAAVPADTAAATAAAPAVPRPAPAAVGLPAAPAGPARPVVVSSPLYRYTFSTRGAALTAAELKEYSSYVQGGRNVQLVPGGAGGVLSHRLVVGRDTLDLRAQSFEPSATSLELSEAGAPRELAFTLSGGAGIGVRLVYTFRPDDYRVGIRGQVTGLSGPATLLTELGPGLAPHDAPEHGSEHELAVSAWNPVEEEVESVALRNVEGGETLAGPFAWAAFKDRYFLLALIGGEQRFERVLVRDLADAEFRSDGDVRTSFRAQATTVLPLGADGAFALEAYLGPQEHGRLSAVGHELEEVNPYGYRIVRPIIRPIAEAILWVLRELHDNLGIAYGWVLVIFGVMMRVVTWPLNAKAMRAQMRNMEKQPILQARMKEVQEKYGDDPRRQQQEMMAVYKELDFSPASMLSGCLPMLIPFPVLVTLFFVFQSAIEFRGTAFGYLPDLSLQDPFYLLPIFLVLSMFVLQWVSMVLSGMEQTPQTKMMLYLMPPMMGALFWAFPSGLNLYYATTNVASLPQQLLIARERRKLADAKKAEDAAAKAAERGARRGPPRPPSTGGARRRG